MPKKHSMLTLDGLSLFLFFVTMFPADASADRDVLLSNAPQPFLAVDTVGARPDV